MRRTRRRRKKYITAFFLGAAVLAVAVWSALPALVERELRERLQAAGFPDADLSVAAVGLREARIDGLRLSSDGGVTAGEIMALYDVGDLLGVRLEGLVVRNLTISGRLDAGGLAIDGLPPSSETTTGFVDAAVLRSLPPIAIESGRIDLVTTVGSVALPFQGTVSPKLDGTAEAVLAVQLDSTDVEARGQLDLALAPDALGAALAIETGTARIAGTASTAFSGRARLDWSAASRPQLSADIELAETAVAGIGFPTGTLEIDANESRWSAQLALAGADGSSNIDVDLAVADPYAQPRLDAAAALRATVGAWIWPALGLPQPQSGDARLDIRLAGPLPADGFPHRSATKPGEMLRVLAAGDIEGTADIVLGNLAFPDLATITSASGHVEIRGAGGSLTIASQSAPRASLTLSPALIESFAMPAGLSERLARPWTAELTFIEPLQLVTEESRTAADAAFGLQLAAESGADITLRFEGRSVLSDGLAVMDSDGRLHVSGTLAEVSLGRLTAGAIGLDVATAIAKTDDRLSIRIVEQGAVTARALEGPPLAGKIETLVLPLEPDETPLVAIDLRQGARPRVTYDLQLGAFKATAPLLLGGAKPLPVAVNLAKTAFSGSWSERAGQDGTLRMLDGVLELPSLGLSARGIEAEIALGPEGSSADLRAAAITHSGKPALMVPLGLFGRADVAAGKLSFTGNLKDKAKHIDLSITGEHAIETGKGRAKVTMPALVFEPGALQPLDIVPAIGREIEEVTGEAAIGGTISWTAGKLTPKLELLLKDLSFRSPQLDVWRLNSVAEIDSLVPFTTPPGQQLSAGLLDVGLPLTDTLAAFRIEPGPRLMIEAARLSLAGGEVSLPPVALDLAQPRTELTLAVRNVDLAKLLELAEIEGLSATGTLTGEIPVAIQADDLLIRDAVLAATGPGTLRYAPSTTPSALLGGGESVTLALQALSNFQYSDLTLTVNRAAGGDTVALMQVKGRNPDFYGGHPVEFNLNISGKLDQILNRGLAGYRIPDTIRDRLGDFAQ